MATQIAMADGTKFEVADDINSVIEMIGAPEPGWVFITEGAETPKRHFNPAQVAYVIEVADSEDMPIIEMH